MEADKKWVVTEGGEKVTPKAMERSEADAEALRRSKLVEKQGSEGKVIAVKQIIQG